MSIKTGMWAALLSLSLLACSGSDDSSHDSAARIPAGDPSGGDPGRASAVADAPAAGACAGADTQLTDARAREYAVLVAGAIEDGKVEPADAKIHRFLGSGAWSTVFASVPIADPGFFVFETRNGQAQFKDVWAGIADEDDSAGLIDWAKALGAPEEFAACFAQTVIG